MKININQHFNKNILYTSYSLIFINTFINNDFNLNTRKYNILKNYYFIYNSICFTNYKNNKNKLIFFFKNKIHNSSKYISNFGQRTYKIISFGKLT